MIVEIAGIRAEIIEKYPYARWLCRDYLAEGEASAFQVSVTQEEIEEVRNSEKNLPEIDICESFALLEQLSFSMLQYDCFLLHAAVIAVDGEAYAFTAQSGTGKSTHIAAWKKYFGDRAVIVNGDKPFLRVIDGIMYACGSPWCGKEGWQSNCMVPLKALCFLERGDTNEIHRIGQAEVIDGIFRQLRLPPDPVRMGKLLDLLDFTVCHVPCYRLQCDQSKEAVRVSYEGMQGESRKTEVGR